MEIIEDLIAASISNIEFKLAWKRARHMRNGHPFTHTFLIDKLYSEQHPLSDETHIYTIGIRKCMDCGLVYHDYGLEYRNH